jgi:hypothetical protein
VSPKPKSRTSLNQDDLLRDLKIKEEEKVSHVDSGNGSKSPNSTDNGKNEEDKGSRCRS